MEKVRPWCGQSSDQGWLRTEQPTFVGVGKHDSLSCRIRTLASGSYVLTNRIHVARLCAAVAVMW